MKVGCQQCGASYSVADEKVAGRRLKMRCKKCGEPMLIDGSGDEPTQTVPLEPETQVVQAQSSAAAGDERWREWYLAGDDSAQGPYTYDAVLAQCADGRVTPDTLVFHDGLERWTEAREVAELQRALREHRPEAAQAIPPPPRARVATPVEPFDPKLAMGSDPFDEPAPAMSPRVSAAEMLASAPRDGTVQFSLDEIRAISATTSSGASAAQVSKPGYASGEGSGLIDMRSLMEGASDDAFRPVSDLQSSPLDTMAPLALPASAGSSAVDFRTKVFAGVAAFACLLAGVVGVLAVTRAPRPATDASAAVPQPAPAFAAQPNGAALAASPEPEAVDAKAEQAPQAPAQDAARDDDEAQANADEAQANADEADEDESEAEQRRDRRSPAERRSARRAERGKRDREPARADKRERDIEDVIARAPAEEKSSASKGGDSIDDLLLGALKGKQAAPKREAAPAPESSLPKAPSRDQVLSALGRAKAKAARCKGSGVATAAITIAGPKGRASKVAVSGVDAAAKSCVEKAVRSTPFPKFQQENFAVSFPFKLSGG